MPPVTVISTLAALLLVGPVVPAPGATSGGAPSASGAANAGGAASVGDYEAVAKGAVRTHDVATLLGPFVSGCDGEKRDVDRARCRAVRAYLRRTLPQQTFAVGSDDPAAIAVSDYDAAVKGYHVSLAGCIACTKPVAVGPGGEPRFVTVKVPAQNGETLPKAVAVTRSTFGFGSLADAHSWLETQRPFMRAEFLFQPQPADADWTFGSNHGVAVKLLGARVYNRCTGQVLMSSPPSTGYADHPAAGDRDPSCRAEGAARVAQIVPPEDLPTQLGRKAIDEAMDGIRAQVFACFQKFHVPGRLEFTYVVAGNGTVQSVVVGPAYAGTSTGLCALAAAKDAHFAQFRIDHQRFTYPFFLRD
jgi:hypothetical protein